MCERCEAIRQVMLEALADAAAGEAEAGNLPDFDAWMAVRPQAVEDFEAAHIPYELARTVWMHGYIAGRLLRELGAPEPAPAPNMPAAEA